MAFIAAPCQETAQQFIIAYLPMYKPKPKPKHLPSNPLEPVLPKYDAPIHRCI
jgi:hypothetical protein